MFPNERIASQRTSAELRQPLGEQAQALTTAPVYTRGALASTSDQTSAHSASTASATSPSAGQASDQASAEAATRTLSRTVNVGLRSPQHVAYTITSTGSRVAEAALFPELNEPRLYFESISKPDYLAAFDRLPPAQKHALRAWAAIDDNDPRSYHDGVPVVTDGINYELNTALTSGRLSRSERQAADHLDAALASMPSYTARLTRVAEHGPSRPSPFGTSIFPGDVVTAGPRFMSASDLHEYSQQNLADGAPSGSCTGADTDTLVFYTLDATSAVPLLEGSVTVATEKEWLFRPKAAFVVMGYATAVADDDGSDAMAVDRPSPAESGSESDSDGDDVEFEGMARRVGVHLQELPGYQGPAKSLYTGAPVNVG